MVDATFDWDQEAEGARSRYLAGLESETVRGQPLSSDRIVGAGEGWSAALGWVRKTALSRMFGGSVFGDAPTEGPR